MRYSNLFSRCAYSALACLLASGRAGGDDAPKPDPVVAELVAAHNRERAREKLPPLTLEAKLEAAAQVHARDMAEHEAMSHEGTDGSTPAQRVEKAGYIYRKTAENVAWGQPDVDAVMKAWMESPHHKENILGDYAEIGVARATAANGAFYWSASFGKPPLRLDPARAAAELVEKLNAKRLEAKVAAVEVDASLAAKAMDLARVRTRGKDAPTPSFDGIDTTKWKKLSMNLAAGPSTPDELIEYFLKSEEQKAQLLAEATRIGVGYASAEDGTAYWSVLLGIPRAPE